MKGNGGDHAVILLISGYDHFIKLDVDDSKKKHRSRAVTVREGDVFQYVLLTGPSILKVITVSWHLQAA